MKKNKKQLKNKSRGTKQQQQQQQTLPSQVPATLSSVPPPPPPLPPPQAQEKVAEPPAEKPVAQNKVEEVKAAPPVRYYRPPPPEYDSVNFDVIKSTQQKSVFEEILGSWNAHEVDPEYDDPKKSEVDFNNTKIRSRYRNWVENAHHILYSPPQVEKTINLGYFMCLESFLYSLSVTPARFLVIFVRWILSLFSSKFRLSRWQYYELVRGSLVLSCLVAMRNVKSSSLYHLIRSQSFIKIYVIYNLLDTIDRLLTILGRDAIEAPYWLIIGKKVNDEKKYPLVVYVVLEFAYFVIHSILLFTQAMVLNVSVNSFSDGFVPLLISHNFSELRSGLFRRFDLEHIYQLCLNDAFERFQLLFYLGIIAIHNFSSISWHIFSQNRMLWVTIKAFLWCMGIEFFVDIVKHVGVNRYNKPPINTYKNFRTMFRVNILSSFNSMPPYESSFGNMRIMNFVVIPHMCVFIHVLYGCVIIPMETKTRIWFSLALYFGIFIARTLLQKFLVIHSRRKLKDVENINEVISKYSDVCRYTQFNGRFAL